MQIPLQLEQGHLFLNIDGNLWLYDTGAPTSFGQGPFAIDGREFHPPASYMGLTVEQLSEFTGVGCRGLLGGDILGEFDHLIDLTNGELTVSSGELEHSGKVIPLGDFMGIPLVPVLVGGQEHKMFFDTGAQISYFQDEEAMAAFPNAGEMEDFYPGFGRFETETRNVDLLFGGENFTVRCGTLPGLLGMSLIIGGASGILGNAIFCDRVIGYFPRRKKLLF